MDIFSGGRTDSGLRVSEMTALQVSTVFACVNLISGAMGALELGVYERILNSDPMKRSGKRLADEHAIFDILQSEPNEEMTSFTFRRTVQCHLLLWGNGYAEVQRDAANRPVALWPRNPARIRPRRSGQTIVLNGEEIRPGELFFTTTEGVEAVDLNPESPNDNEGPERIIHRSDVLHLPGLSLDGRIGQGVIWLTRQVIGLALAAEKFGSKFYGNGARPSIAIEIPGKMKPEALEVLRRSFQESVGGENVHRPLVLTEGQKLTPFSTKPSEGQFLELREYQKEEICSIFGVHPYMIGQTEKANRSTAEQMSIEFVRFTLESHIVAWEQELKRKLFPRLGRNANRYFAKFDTQPLMMPDAESQRAFFSSGKQWGFLSTNMILEMLDMNPIDDPDADALWMPVNMQKMGAQATGATTASPLDDETTNKEDDSEAQAQQKSARSLINGYSRWFRQAFGHICKENRIDFVLLNKTFQPLLLSIADAIRSVTYDLVHETEQQKADAEADLEPFITDYIQRMHNRVEEWRTANGNAAKVCERELDKAVRAISFEVYRQLPADRAKRLLAVNQQPEQRAMQDIAIHLQQPAALPDPVAVPPVVNMGDIRSHITLETKPGILHRIGHLVRNLDGSMSFDIKDEVESNGT